MRRNASDAHAPKNIAAAYVLGVEDHIFDPPGLGINNLGTDYNGWRRGRELSAGYYASDWIPPAPPPTPLRTESTTWEQRGCNLDTASAGF